MIFVLGNKETSSPVRVRLGHPWKSVIIIHIPPPTKLIMLFLITDVFWYLSVLVKIWFIARVSIVIIRAPYTQTPYSFQRSSTFQKKRDTHYIKYFSPTDILPILRNPLLLRNSHRGIVQDQKLSQKPIPTRWSWEVPDRRSRPGCLSKKLP